VHTICQFTVNSFPVCVCGTLSIFQCARMDSAARAAVTGVFEM